MDPSSEAPTLSQTGLMLAIEAATPVASVALLRGGEILYARATNPERTLSETLLPCIEQLLREADIQLPEVTAYAVSIGPGSFTSLRVGISTVKGLAFGSEAPVMAVPTLAALALAGADAGCEGIVVSVLDAGRGEVYAGGYAPGEWTPRPELPESVYTPETLLDRLPVGAALVGEAVSLLREVGGDSGVALLDLPVSARAVGRLGTVMGSAGCCGRAEDLAPHYVRRAEAEARRTGQALEEGSAPARP